MKKRILFLLLAGLMLLSGCGNVDDSVSDQVFDELSQYYQSDEPDTPAPLTAFVLPYLQGQTLDPITCPDGAPQTLGSLLYEGLFALDTQLMPEKVLAKSYTYDAASFTYTITLRSDAKFSDGSSLTAQDVADTLQRARTSERYGTRLANVDSISTDGSHTVYIRLKAADSFFTARLDVPIVKSGTEDRLVPFGTGPYRYKTGKGGASYLEANSSWWQDESLPMERIDLLTVKDNDTLAYAFYAREAQLMTCDLTATGSAAVSGSGSYTDADTTVMQYIGINTTRKPLDNPAVRRALSLGIDRVSCVNAFLMGHGAAAQFPVSPASALYPAASETTYSPDNYAQAAKKAGLRSGSSQKLTMLVNEENSYKVAMAQKIAADLSAYDLKITVEALPWDAYLSALKHGRFDLYLGECKLTADWDLSPLLLAKGDLNYGGFSEKSTTDLLGRYLSSSSKERQSNMQYLCQKLQQQAPILPICFKRTSILVTAGAVDTITPTAANPFYGLSSWKVNLK